MLTCSDKEWDHIGFYTFVGNLGTESLTESEFRSFRCSDVQMANSSPALFIFPRYWFSLNFNGTQQQPTQMNKNVNFTSKCKWNWNLRNVHSNNCRKLTIPWEKLRECRNVWDCAPVLKRRPSAFPNLRQLTQFPLCTLKMIQQPRIQSSL